MQLLNKLNGWQRVFVLICVFSFAFSLTKIQAPEVNEDDINIFSFLPELPNRPCLELTKDECEVIELIRGKNLKPFILANGQRLNLDDRYTSEQVEHAYEQAKNLNAKMINDVWINAFKKTLIYLIASLIGLYFLGWMIGWIWRGFLSDK